MSCPNNPRPRIGAAPAFASPGFTLLELLIAIVLLSVVMVLLYGALSQITSGTTSLNEELAKQQETRLLLRMITDDLQAVNYFDQFVKGEDAKSGIIVSKDSLGAKYFSRAYFHANVPTRFHRRVDRQADPLMHELAYWVEASEEDRELMVLKRREDFYLDNDMEEGGITAEIAEGIASFRIELLGEVEQSLTQEGDWLEDWDSNEGKKGNMPLAIRVTLALVRKANTENREETLEINIESSLGGKP